MFGSPLTWFDGLGGDRILRAVASQLLINGFANPLGLALVLRELQDPDAVVNPVMASATAAGVLQAAGSALRASASKLMGYIPILDFPFLKASSDMGYSEHADGSGYRWRITHPIRVSVTDRTQVPATGLERKGQANAMDEVKGPKRSADPVTKTMYKVKVWDLTAPWDMQFKTFWVAHADLLPNPDQVFNMYVLPFFAISAMLDVIVQSIANEVATLTGIPADELNVNAKDSAKFMHEDNNPISKAFETTAGRGLAGVITSLNYEWISGDTITWDLDWNSRAPMLTKVTMGFKAIHDLPPGLDYSGYNRAPIYNVGDIMQKVAGDPYRDSGRGSHDVYRNQGGRAAEKNKS